jgi:hypothetical protein
MVAEVHPMAQPPHIKAKVWRVAAPARARTIARMAAQTTAQPML